MLFFDQALENAIVAMGFFLFTETFLGHFPWKIYPLKQRVASFCKNDARMFVDVCIFFVGMIRKGAFASKNLGSINNLSPC